MLARDLRFSLLLALVFVLPIGVPAVVAEEAPPRFENLTLDLNNLNPAWWEGFIEANATERARFFERLDSELARILPSAEERSAQQALLVQLATSLQRSEAQTLPEPELPAVQANYSFDEWLRLLRRVRALAQQVSETEQTLNQLATTVAFHRKRIATALLRYRDLSVQDAEKQPLALTILRSQLELLNTQLAEQRQKLQFSKQDAALSQVRDLMAIGLERVVLREEERQQLTEQLESARAELEQVLKRQADQRIAQLQQADGGGPAAEVETGRNAGLALAVRATILQLERQRNVTALLAAVAPDQLEKPTERNADLVAEISSQRAELNRLQERLLGNQQLTDAQRYALVGQVQQVRTTLEEASVALRDAALLAEQEARLVLASQAWWESPLEELKALWQRSGALLWEWFTYPLFSVNESPVSSFDILWMILIITAAGFVSRQLRRLIIRIGTAQQTFSDAAVFTIGRILHYVVMAVAVVVGLSSIGLDLSNVALVAGALSVGIGFGLQSIFNNFISGLILLFERPFRVGDLVELESGVRGRIRSINVRSTHINTWDNIDVLVPNSEFIGGRVTNYTLGDDVRRLHIAFGVAYGTDKELVRKAALEAAVTVRYTLNGPGREPDVWLVNFGDSSLDFELIVWIHHNQLPAGHNPTTDYLWAIETALGHYGIEIPFPQRDLHLRSVDGQVIAAVSTPLRSRSGNPSER